MLVGTRGKDVLRGEDGNDSFAARDRTRDSVNGGPGEDSARVDRGLDRVRQAERLLP